MGGGEGAELNTRILHSLATCIREQEGPEALERVVAAAGLATQDFAGHTRWISLEQAESFLAHARRLFVSDEAFRDACAYQFNRSRASYGPFLLLVRAASPWATFKLACMTLRLISRISRFELQRRGGRYTVRYRSKRLESHLMCLSRIGQLMAVPTLWGLPPAQIAHPRCIARGDSWCEYSFDLAEPVRWLPAALGLTAGLAVLGGLHLFIGPSLFTTLWPLALPVVFLIGGAGLEWRRSSRANLTLALEMQEGVTELAAADAEARRELLAFQQRQRDWTRIIEEQLGERLATQQKVVEEIRSLEARRVEALRAFTHDLRNPLFLVTASAETVRDGGRPFDQKFLDDVDKASRRMKSLLESLMDTLENEETLLKLSPREMPVPPLVDKLRRRLGALCYHRDIRPSVFSTREAPGSIVIDEILFDRVIDNLFSNAAKYTEQGSILVEVGGTPGFLTVKVSDTGRGIAQEAIEQVFRPGGSDPTGRARDSYGLGLSVVVQLLASAGGKLEVMSKPGVGTTFWAHFPLRPAAPPAAKIEADEDLVRKVVRIRKIDG